MQSCYRVLIIRIIGREYIGTFFNNLNEVTGLLRSFYTGKGEESMIQLNYRDPKPIYEQIKDGFRKMIITKLILKDEKLPSVRELASELVINPNTIQRAYRELEAEGYIYTVSGKGSFVADVGDIIAGRNKELLDRFDDIVKELLYLLGDKEELKKRIDDIAKGGEEE